MIHIEKIKLINQTFAGTSVLKKDFEITCSDVNLFVGDQGTGKSTYLKLLQQSHSDLEITLSENVRKNGVSSFYFDSEKDNPRIKDPQLYANIRGQSVGFGYGNAIASRFMSHGEVLKGFVITPLETAKDCVLLMDEPESGMSITNQFKLIELIKKAIDNNCQFFIATHCYPLIESFDVISLQHNKQMKGIDFIKSLI